MKLRRTATLVTSFLAAALTFTGAGAAAAADTQAAGGYVALGDSYSSGVGAGSYDSGSGDCRRTPKAYPALWAAANSPASFDFVACSGAKTGDVLANQLGPLNSSTGLVSLTIGGNDAGFADVMTTCVLKSEATCVARVNEAKAFVESSLPAKLDSVYSQIRSKAPSANVVVLGYPRFYKLNGSCVAGLTEGERTAINGAADLLNSVISKRAADHGYAYGDIAAAFTGHEICSGDSWLHSVKWTGINDSYHPTAAGQSGGYLPVLNSRA
ncbi:SGNH/GDSL hydrolase family protein [Streptomyces diastaticus]|uniref:SGNH/GDSL hydrolase family protein n=1 Tax=Streptomyces diastaticus TaxID=1956 RepID=UPI0036617DFD